MAQAFRHPCPQCGALVDSGQRFCSNCGAVQDMGTGIQTQSPPMSGGVPPDKTTEPPSLLIAPPPPPDSYGTAASPVTHPYGIPSRPPSYAQQPMQSGQNYAASPNAPLPAYATVPKKPGRGRWGLGCALAALVLLLVLGGAGYYVYTGLLHLGGSGSQTEANSGSATKGSTSTDTTPTGPTAATVTFPAANATITYAGDVITIVDAKQASSFADDPTGTLRLDVGEVAGAKVGNFYFSDILHLVLPDGSTLAENHALTDNAPAVSTSRVNWVDFVAPPGVKISSLVARFGTATDAQIAVPLTGTADLGKYQTQTTTLNTPINYSGLNWTLLTATHTYSASGQQATTGMRFVILTFKIDNPTSGGVVTQFPEDYMRLKSADITNSPVNSALPASDAGTTGVTGTVTFLMPTNDTAFTLIFLASQSSAEPNSSVPVNTNFTMQQ